MSRNRNNNGWCKWNRNETQLGENMVAKLMGMNNHQTHQKVSTYEMSWNKEEDWKTRDDSEMVWDVSSLFASGDVTFHDDNNKLTNHQSAVLWFKCDDWVRQNRMRTTSIENEPVEAEMWLTLPIVGCSRVFGFSNYEEIRRRDNLPPTFN